MDPRNVSLNGAASPPRKLVLASTSPYRKQLLARLRVPFYAVNPNVDETPLQQSNLPAIDMARALAEAKAHAAFRLHPQDIIIGCDQCAVIDKLVLNKPGTASAAIAQLSMLAGRTHRLLTAVRVLDGPSGQHSTSVDVHEMTMRRLSAAQIRRYVEIDQPLDCAGSYKIESLGVALFERVSGIDPTAIMGMPLGLLVSMLGEVGYDVFDYACSVDGRPPCRRHDSYPTSPWSR